MGSSFATAKEVILDSLESIGLCYEGGKTTHQLVDETGYAYRTVQETLRSLEKSGQAYRCHVKAHSRKDGRTGPMWYRAEYPINN